MIYIIPSKDHPYSKLLKDDPVRPNISPELRFGPHRYVIANENNGLVEAIVCSKACSKVPTSEEELLSDPGGTEAIVFYTIWSYKKGAGADLINEGIKMVKQELPFIKRYVTLSPTTEMAKRFHLKNGASIFRENATTVNYEYNV